MTFLETFESTVRTISAIGTLSLGVAVASVSRSQWRTNQEKLRLDLYGRRFEIFNRVYDAYDALIGWNDTEEQKAIITQFYRAYRESRFLFPEVSGVYRHLEDFAKHASYITNFKLLREGFQGLPKELAEAGMKRMDHVNWIVNSMPKLEECMAPYLNFHKL